MRFRQVCLESLGYVLPEEVVTSQELERRLAPVYQRLRLPEGRLELMTGIRERRFWPPGTLPSDKSVESGELALRAAGWDRRRVGALVHASVCRDYLEPATASSVHHRLGLPPDCLVYDVSNACLGLLNGVLQVANMIELGQIEAGLVVGAEDSRPLVEHTIATLNDRPSLTRREMKLAMASLTIGSGSCALLLVRRELSRTGNRLTAAAFRAETRFHQLCHSGRDEAVGSGMRPLMDTDAETLLREGVAAGARTFVRFLAAVGWSRDELDRTFCHQVGAAHHRAVFEALGLDSRRDYATYPWLGNTGSVALPLTLAHGAEQGCLAAGHRAALLGIGSGINCVMLGLEWRKTLVRSSQNGRPPAGAGAEAAEALV